MLGDLGDLGDIAIFATFVSILFFDGMGYTQQANRISPTRLLVWMILGLFGLYCPPGPFLLGRLVFLVILKSAAKIRKILRICKSSGDFVSLRGDFPYRQYVNVRFFLRSPAYLFLGRLVVLGFLGCLVSFPFHPLVIT